MSTYTKQEQTCTIIAGLLLFLFYFIFIGFPAVLWQIRRPRKQVIQKRKVCVVFVFRYLCQKMLHIVIDFQTICLRSFSDAVDYGAGFRPADGIDQPPVVLADTKAPQRGFGCIVVQGGLHRLPETPAETPPGSGGN